MSAPINRRWVLARRPQTMIDQQTFELVEGPAPSPREGEFVVRLCYLSLAPVMRAYVIDGGVIENPLGIGETMRGRGVGYVVESAHPDYAEGDIVHGPFGWQDYAVSDGSGRVFKLGADVPSISAALGALGLTGFTAYFGLFDKGQPNAGETVLVSGAVGGVGSVVGQLAKISGCRAIAIAGGAEKCRLATEQLGYAAAIDYKHDDVGERIDALAPDGIDIYFDNVGGDTLEAAIARMADDGRIVVCGAISQYTNEDGKPVGPSNYFDIVYRNVSMLGFHIYSYRARYPEAERRMARWLWDGRLVNLEDRMHGLETMPAALISLFEGGNVGKRVVKIAEEPNERRT